jgi:hypothetical protein
VPESIKRVAKLSRQIRLQILGNSEQRHGGNKASVLQGVKRFDTHVVNLRPRYIESVRDGDGKIEENLL